MIIGNGFRENSGAGPVGGWVPEYLIWDEFLDNHPAGTVNNTAATPGPGTRTVTDTESKISVGSGVMTVAGGKASPAFGDPSLWFGATSRVDGIALIGKFTATSGTIVYGLGLNTTGAPLYGMYYDNNGTIYARNGATVAVASWTVGSGTNKFVLVGGNGYLHHFIETSGQWTLLWTAPVAVAATVYPGASNYNCVCSTDYLRCIALPAPFDTDDGIATDVKSGNVATGTIFAHESDFIMEFTVTTLQSGGDTYVRFRVQDALNYWTIVYNSSGNFYLYEFVNNVPTQRGVSVAGVSSGHQIVIIAEGSTIKGYSNNTLRFSYASATNFATATSGAVSSIGTGGAVSDLKTWPRTLSGRAKQILDIVSN